MSHTTSLRAERLEDREVPAAVGIFALGAGPGGPPRVQVFDTATGNRVADFFAFEPTFTGGVNAAVADVNNDGFADVLVGAGQGGGPRVRVFDGKAFRPASAGGTFTGSLDANAAVLADFFAFEDSQRGGTNVAFGTFNADLSADPVIGAGPGGGPRVRVLDGGRMAAQGRAFAGTAAADTLADFFAFESSFRNGVSVAANPILPVGGLSSDLVVSPGFGGGPRVRVLSGQRIAAQAGQGYTGDRQGDTVADFFAAPADFRGGMFVASADLSGDGQPDVVAGTGPGAVGQVTVYDGIRMRTQPQFSGAAPGDVLERFDVAGSGYTGGVSVGSAVIQGGLAALMIHGFGQPGLSSRAEVSRFTFGPGFFDRQAVYSISFDPSLNTRVNASN